MEELKELEDIKKKLTKKINLKLKSNNKLTSELEQNCKRIGWIEFQIENNNSLKSQFKKELENLKNKNNFLEEQKNFDDSRKELTIINIKIARYKRPNKFYDKESKFVSKNYNAFKKILGNQCRLCDDISNHIIFHHIRYHNLPKNDLIKYSIYLIPLCPDCHGFIHKTTSIPKSLSELKNRRAL